MKKFLAILLSVILVASVISIPAMAAVEESTGVIVMQPRGGNPNGHMSSFHLNGSDTNDVRLVNNSSNHITMPFEITMPGTYCITGLIGTTHSSMNARVCIDCADVSNNDLFTKYKVKTCTSVTDYQWNDLGTVTFAEAGSHTLSVKITALGYTAAFSELRLTYQGLAHGNTDYSITKTAGPDDRYEVTSVGNPSGSATGISIGGYIGWELVPAYTGKYDIAIKAGSTAQNSLWVYKCKAVDVKPENLMSEQSVYIEGSTYGKTEYVSFGKLDMIAGNKYYVLCKLESGSGSLPYVSGIKATWEGNHIDTATVTESFSTKDDASLKNKWGVYPGDWISWDNVFIPDDGNYTFTFNGGVQAESEIDLSFDIIVDGQDTMSAIAPWTGLSNGSANTGWNTKQKTVAGIAALKRGFHNLKFKVNGDGPESTYYFDIIMEKIAEYNPLNTGRDIILTETRATHDRWKVSNESYGLFTGDWIEWDINVPVDGNYEAIFTGGVQATSEVPMSLVVSVGPQAVRNDVPWTGGGSGNAGWNTPTTASIGTLAVREGRNVLRIHNLGAASTNSFTLRLKRVGDYNINMEDVLYQAFGYDSTNIDLGAHASYSGHSLSIYQSDRTATYTVDVPAGNYDFSMYYGSYWGAPTVKLVIDGSETVTVALPEANGYNGAKAWADDILKLSLSEGKHTIKFCDGGSKGKYSWGYFKLTPIDETVVKVFADEEPSINDAEISKLTSGTLTAKALLSADMKDKNVTMFFAIYEVVEGGEELVAVKPATFKATEDAAPQITLTDVTLDDTKTYTSKVIFVNNTDDLVPYYDVQGVFSNK